VDTIVQADTNNGISLDFLKPEAVTFDQCLAHPFGAEATAAEFLDCQDGGVFRSAICRRFADSCRSPGRAAERSYKQDRRKRGINDLCSHRWLPASTAGLAIVRS